MRDLDGLFMALALATLVALVAWAVYNAGAAL